ncbi:MAG: hypothetical protein JWM47_3449 [Acidimicrobiales bacterium]|nr:hypothetical protein [Acidimicrobiales bacterium]
MTWSRDSCAWRPWDLGHGWQTWAMPMQQDCKFFESRTYRNGETVRKCDLDLAPEAPWRCPTGCSAYQPRLADVNWKHGTLVTPPTPPEPPGLDERGDEIAALLDAAEDIVNAAGPSIMAELAAEDARAAKGGRLSRLFKRKRRDG